MNEITKIHLGRQAFTIAVDAHKALQEYLHEIKREVGPRGTDVVDEVELRMAELLAERGVQGDKVVLADDVDYLKEQLGSPKDFKGDDDDMASDQPAEETKQSKRLFRDPDNALLAGVCAGLAKYFGVDATIVRLLFVALLFFGGGGILLYIVLWLIVPEAKTTSDKLQMQGKPVTVESLKELVDRADVEGAAKRAGKRVEPAALLLVKVLVAIIGMGVTAVAFSMLIAVTTVAIFAFASHGIMVGGEKLFPVGTKETWALLSGLTAAGIVGLFGLFGGIGMVVRKWKVPGWISGALVGVFLLGVAAAAALGIDTAPRIHDRFDAMHHSQVVAVQPFTKLQLHGNSSHDTRYEFHPSNEYKIVYNYLGKAPTPSFNKGVKDGILTLDTTEMQHHRCDILCGYDDWNMTITVYAPTLESVVVRGENVTFDNATAFKQNDISIDVDRMSNVELRYMNPQKVKLTANPDQSASHIQITGMRDNAFQEDSLTGYDQTFTLSRASEVEFNTNANCGADQPMLDLLSYPDKLTLNGHVFPTKGDLNAEHGQPHTIYYGNNAAPETGPGISPFDCVRAN
jgi:phage shock protein PspC (stress-responsive transcriptional regulator)